MNGLSLPLGSPIVHLTNYIRPILQSFLQGLGIQLKSTHIIISVIKILCLISAFHCIVYTKYLNSGLRRQHEYSLFQGDLYIIPVNILCEVTWAHSIWRKAWLVLQSAVISLLFLMYSDTRFWHATGFSISQFSPLF